MRWRCARTSRRPATRRGYALVLVTLLTMVSTMAVAVILQRHAAVSRSVQRQVEQTRQRHIERGLRELLSGWLRTMRGDSVASRLGADGHALDIELPAGEVSVWLHDAQGLAMAGFDALPDQEAERARAIYEALARRVGPGDLERMTRLVGPPRISIATAPLEVLEAAIESVLGEGQAREVAQALREAASEGSLTDTELRNQTLSRAGVEQQDRSLLLRVITAEPELWELDIRSFDSRGRDAGRYRGLVSIPRRQGGARSGSVMSYSPLGPFLHWERVEAE